MGLSGSGTPSMHMSPGKKRIEKCSLLKMGNFLDLSRWYYDRIIKIITNQIFSVFEKKTHFFN